ncbi:NAD(P)/FAD-dependent oxidoreductase [Methylobacterium radiodurans]|uniref:NAD/FAD-dependent oxidoreductase n=1 Tax=Methylobacterium radiodurans TaxID=2202828 RepID=A0A2U8VMC8_9HYPH|nr:FAD-dependent oxidoreductase [Methylobacterium radiodurans]AWN34727.1 NAD/FAD-dependent oxidoreductase [Methylobacterium radiodurans]
MRIAIVGAGLAGLTCGRALAAEGCPVALFDKGRAPGGRLSTRRTDTSLGPVAFDLGAPFITADDPAFGAELAVWQAEGTVARWPAAGARAWVGIPGMDAPLRAMGRGLPVRWSTRVEAVAAEAGGWRLQGADLDAGGFDVVLTALPAEQTATLLRPAAPDLAAVAAALPSAPCWTAMAAFARRLDGVPDLLSERGGPGDTFAWAAREAAKPGRSGPESWVIQAGPDWSRRNLERAAADVAADLLGRFFAAAGVAAVQPVHLAGHRWRYAASGAAGRNTLWDPTRGIGACGDWLLGPRAEHAWLSGRRLASAVAATRASAASQPGP